MKPITARSQRVASMGAFGIWLKAQQLAEQGVDIIRLEVGEPDFDTPTHIVEAGVRAMQNGRTRYNYSTGISELRQAMTDYVTRTRQTAVSPTNILVAPGVKAMLFYALLALVEEGDEVLMPDPGFPGYIEITNITGGTPIPYTLLAENDYQPDPDEIASLITERTKCILLTSPGNPTGMIADQPRLERIAELALQHDLWVLSDEIYAQLYYTPDFPPSIFSLPEMAKRTILLDGMSKPYAMTGWRCGFGVFPEPLVDPVNKLMVNSHTCLPLFVQDAAIAALNGPQECVTEMREAYRQRRDMIVAELATMPQLSYVKPNGAFYVMLGVNNGRSASDRSASDLCNDFLQAGVSLLPCAGMGEYGKNFIRMAFTKPADQLQEAIRRMKTVL